MELTDDDGLGEGATEGLGSTSRRGGVEDVTATQNQGERWSEER